MKALKEPEVTKEKAYFLQLRGYFSNKKPKAKKTL
jgi:hypothetical protein